MELLISSLLNFGLVVVILWHFGRKPATRFLEARSDQMEKAIAEGKALVSDATRELDRRERDWNERDAEAERLLQDARASLERYRNTSRLAVLHEVARIRGEAQMAISSETLKAKSALFKLIAHESSDLALGFLKSYGHEEQARRELVQQSVEAF